MSEPDTTTRLAAEPITLRGGPVPLHPRPEPEDGDDLVTRALVQAAHGHAAGADEARRRAEQARQELDRWEAALGESRMALQAITSEVERRRQVAAPIVVQGAVHARSVPPHLGLDPARVGVTG